MLRTTIGNRLNLTKQLPFTEWIGINSTFSQTIRWKRKPIWLPPAKSKLFRVPSRHKPPPDELLEIQRLFNNYRTCRTSIKKYFMKIEAANRLERNPENFIKAEEEDYDRCVKINEEWNNEAKKIRDQRLEKERVEEEADILRVLAEKEIQEKMRLEEIEEKVRKVKLEAVSFITSKNVDQAIAEAMENVTSYNVAIDTAGNKYDGIHIEDTKSETRTATSVN